MSKVHFLVSIFYLSKMNRQMGLSSLAGITSDSWMYSLPVLKVVHIHLGRVKQFHVYISKDI